MRRPALAAAGLLALVTGFVASILLASELGGEVVSLQTFDADGSLLETRLWIVDSDGSPWLRAGDPASSWLARIEANDRISLVRGGKTRAMRAVPVREPVVRDQIHARMREKYGFADRWISIIRDDSKSIPVRLESR